MSRQQNITRKQFITADIEELEQNADYIELHVKPYDENDNDITACFSVSLDDLIS